MRISLLIISTFLCTLAFGQTYSYSFGGKIDSESGNTLTSRCAALPEVESCKLRYKENEEKGELIIVIQPVIKEGTEGNPSFSPIDIKRILIELGLNPIGFNEISK